jgi:hypothetical protein
MWDKGGLVVAEDLCGTFPFQDILQKNHASPQMNADRTQIR